MVGINHTVILVFIVFFDTTSKLMTNDVPIFYACAFQLLIIPIQKSKPIGFYVS